MKRSPLQPKPGKPWKKLGRKKALKRGAIRPQPPAVLIDQATQAPARKPVAYKGIPPEVKAAVAARSGGMCEARTPWCKGSASQYHHKRGRGPGMDTEENLLHVCGGQDACHPGYIHGHPEESYRRGWMVKRNSVSPG